MKKLIIFFSALALISSCAKLELTEPDQNGDSSNNATLKTNAKSLFAFFIKTPQKRFRLYCIIFF